MSSIPRAGPPSDHIDRARQIIDEAFRQEEADIAKDKRQSEARQMQESETLDNKMTEARRALAQDQRHFDESMAFRRMQSREEQKAFEASLHRKQEKRSHDVPPPPSQLQNSLDPCSQLRSSDWEIRRLQEGPLSRCEEGARASMDERREGPLVDTRSFWDSSRWTGLFGEARLPPISIAGDSERDPIDTSAHGPSPGQEQSRRGASHGATRGATSGASHANPRPFF